MIYVPAEGPANSTLAVVGEAPGGEEERLGRPFVGPTGKMVDDLLIDCNFPRPKVYLTNVVKVRPPGNQIKLLPQLGKKIDDFIPQLHEEIRQLNPNAVLALGNTALTALTGYHGIEKYRGSILPANFGPWKVIPTLHPASLLHKESDGKLRSWKDLTFIRWDFARAVSQSKFAEYRPPVRDLSVCRSALQLHRFLSQNQDREFLSVDIETFRTIPICIAFAFNSHQAMSVPLFKSMCEMTNMDMISCWEMITDVLSNPRVMKIGQNFKFDEKLIHTCVNGTVNFGLKTNSFFFDTMLAFNTLYPELPGRLQFSTSVLTEEPYYKDEGKEYNPKKDKFDRLLLYNAKDAAVTYEVFERESEELRERNLEEFFFEKVMPLHPFYSRLEKRGIKRDEFQKRFLEEKYRDKEKELAEELDSLIHSYWYEGDETRKRFNPASPKQVWILLYEEMRIPERKGTDEKTLDALMRNAVKDEKKRRIIELILEIRKVRKTIGTYIDHEVDFRGRTLTSVRITLETGRTSTSILQPPVSTHKMGLAFQTITKHGDVGQDLRSMLVPDEGFIFIEPDLSGAEARVVATLARDDKLLKMFKYEVDVHSVTEGWIENCAPNELLEQFFLTPPERSQELADKINKVLKSLINNDQRQIGKKFRHAGHYDMGKREASSQIGISEYKAGKILDKFHATNPNIRNVFHKEIIEALRNNNRTLISPHGRARQFLNRWGQELFKEAYAQIPQATVSDHNKFAMIRIERRAPWLQILEESHDSFLGEIPPAKLDCTIRIIKEELETPIDFSKCSLSRGELIIPCEIKIGDKNWEDMKKVA